MISYIFKSRVKNVIVTILAAIYTFILLKDLQQYLIIYGDIKNITPQIIAILPYVLILIYMLTLKRNYRFKNWLFPVAFATLILDSIYSISYCFDQYTFKSLNGIIVCFIGLIIRLIMVLGSSFCFVGTLSNFKRPIFLRIGIPLYIIAFVVLSTADYITNWVMANTFFSTLTYLTEDFRVAILLLLYAGIFALTLTKKGEYIDITPFEEARKLKKAQRKEKRLQKKLALQAEESFTPPEVAEGFWRCMGCGEILPNSKTECQCGYKKGE